MLFPMKREEISKRNVKSGRKFRIGLCDIFMSFEMISAAIQVSRTFLLKSQNYDLHVIIMYDRICLQ